jgi:ATP-binding cassette subfamily B protein
MAEATGKAFDKSLLNRVMIYAKPYMRIFYLAFFLTVVLAALGVARPWLIGKAIDVYVADQDPKGLLYITLLVVGILLLEAVAQFYQTYYSNWIGQSVTIDLRSKLFSHITGFKLK